MGWKASDTASSSSRTPGVPKENVLGPVGDGFVNFLQDLDGGGIGIAALSLGIAEGAYEQALAYAGTRKQFGKFIGSFQAITSCSPISPWASRWDPPAVHRRRHLKQAKRPFKKEARWRSSSAPSSRMKATTQAVQIFGGYGYTTEYPVERMMRDAKVCEIGEGTSEIQRMVIARQILGTSSADVAASTCCSPANPRRVRRTGPVSGSFPIAVRSTLVGYGAPRPARHESEESRHQLTTFPRIWRR